jgi:endonuclease G
VGKGFNQGVWNDLEKYTRALARKYMNVYVCSGPLYLPRFVFYFCGIKIGANLFIFVWKINITITFTCIIEYVHIIISCLITSSKEADGKLYVKYEVIGKNHVSVPTHFFKVIVMENDRREFEMNSFVIPNQYFPEKTQLKNFLVPVETIERAAGFILFEGVPKNRLKTINGKKV